jgi:DNA-binding transcriptional LysR family regulator
MDTLQSLRLFSEVARSGSFSAAGRAAGLSTASVSRHVLALENSLGVQLVNRSTRHCSLTDAGNSFHDRLQSIFEQLQQATEEVKSLQTNPQGLLRVHARVALGTLCIAPALPHFLEQNPDVQVRLSLSNDNGLDLITHGIDIDLRTGLLPDSALISRKLSRSRRLLVASPAYVAQYGMPRVPADLAAHNCLIYRVSNDVCVWRFRDASGKVEELYPSGKLESDSGAVLIEAAYQGIGISHQTDWAVAGDIRSGRLVQLLPAYDVTINDFDHGVFALYTPSRHSSPKVRVFLDFLVKLFKTTQFRLEDHEMGQAVA